MRWVGIGSPSLIVPYDATLKEHLCISDDSYQTLVTHYIKSTGEQLEKMVGYPLRWTSINVYTSCKNSKIELPKNIGTISKIEYLEDFKWVELTITTNDYTIVPYNNYNELMSSLLVNKYEYKITATATVDTQEVIKTAAMQMILEKYEMREDREVKNTYSKATDYLLANITNQVG